MGLALLVSSYVRGQSNREEDEIAIANNETSQWEEVLQLQAEATIKGLKNGAVATDHPVCSKIGNEVGGRSAVCGMCYQETLYMHHIKCALLLNFHMTYLNP